MLGDFDVNNLANTHDFQTASNIFVAITIIIPVTALNLLISIVSDTYARYLDD